MGRSALIHLIRSQSRRLSSSTFNNTGYGRSIAGTWSPSSSSSVIPKVRFPEVSSFNQRSWASSGAKPNDDDEHKISIGPQDKKEEDNGGGGVVYYGPISSTIKKVKLLSLSTCCLSVSLGPVITFMTSPGLNVIMKGAVASTVIFLSASTTAALHWFVSPYVHKLRWQPGSGKTKKQESALGAEFSPTMSLHDSDSEDIREHEDRTAPSECDLAHAIPHGSSDLALKMSLMEKRLGSMELLHRDKPANYVVVEALEGLNLHIQHFAGKKTSIFIPIIKASLSNYCTLQEMQKTMLLTVEAYFTSLFVNDKLGRQVYEVCSLYSEIVRRDEANKEATAKELVAVAVKSIEAALESKSLTNQTIRQGMKGMITCLSNFYTREKMLEYMTSSTGLTAKQAEHLFNRHIGNDAVRREAYHKRAAMSAGIHAREKQAAAEPAKGGDPVPEIIKGLECDLKALANQKIQVIFQSLKTCLSQYYTLEEMKTHMSAAVEQYYTSLFVDDKLGREAYLEKSLRRAPARRHEAEEAAALLQSEEEAMASKLASQVTKELQDHIETNNDQGSRKMMECMITCLSSYFTLKEMQIYMSSRTDFQATSVEIWYTKQLAQRDPAAHEAYVAVSSRMESLRAQQQQHASTSYSGGEGK